MIDLRELLALSIAVTIQQPWQPNMAGPWASCSEHTKRKAFDAADNILAAPDAYGLVAVPREASYAMQNVAIDVDSYKLGDISPLGFRCSPQKLFARRYAAMLSASPYAKKEVGR